MSLQLKFYAGLLAVGGVYVATSAADLTVNYTEVQARITKSTTDCYIENRNGRITDRRTDELAYMDCDIAPDAAAAFGYASSDIHRRSSYEFVYASPVDGSRQTGSAVDRNAAEGEYARGAVIDVYGHNEQPATYRMGL